METMGVNKEFWSGKKVFVTGHTGFKGSWMGMWLLQLGAEVTGYSLLPPTNPSLFYKGELQNKIHSIIGDIRDYESLYNSMIRAEPDIVIHMAAQPLVRYSYENPVETYSTNVMGTVNLLEAVRHVNTVRAVVNVTTDKCYENTEMIWSYREHDRLGGYDPYSNSKACSEMVTSAYRNSFFNTNNYDQHRVAIASARAGNVIGGGDWAQDRLIPDCLNALMTKKTIQIRNPKSIRPWQHVLEPLSGYLQLAERLFVSGPEYADSWNFGPKESDAKPVEWIVETLCSKWVGYSQYEVVKNLEQPHEATYLKLDCTKADVHLNWQPKWSLNTALDKIIEWNLAYMNGDNVFQISANQITDYSLNKSK